MNINLQDQILNILTGNWKTLDKLGKIPLKKYLAGVSDFGLNHKNLIGLRRFSPAPDKSDRISKQSCRKNKIWSPQENDSEKITKPKKISLEKAKLFSFVPHGRN